MNDIKELLLDLVYGFKKMFMALGVILLGMSMIWGILSALCTIFGEIEFQWWNIPFWVLVFCILLTRFCQDRD